VAVRKGVTGMTRRIKPAACAALLVAAVWVLGASAAEVKTLAIMLPEEPTDIQLEPAGLRMRPRPSPRSTI